MTTATYTFDEDSVSDLHKDAYGFRPSQSWWYGWDHASDEGKQHQWDSMLAALERANEEDREREARAIKVFEDRVTNLMHSGTTQERVITWLIDASDANGDVEYFEYLNGLPYGYINKIGA